VSDTSFRDKILESKKDSKAKVSNLVDIEKRADEGKAIVLKNNPLGILLFYGIVLAVFIAAVIIMSLTTFDIVTVIILFSVWGGSVLITILVVLTHAIILHPEGFFLRKRIFHTFSQKWINLTSEPETAIYIDSAGSKHHVLKFIGS